MSDALVVLGLTRFDEFNRELVVESAREGLAATTNRGRNGGCPHKLSMRKLRSSKRQQNALAAAIKEWGLLRRTLSVTRILADKALWPRIACQLNKGD